jgi:hypothetical protein
MPEATPSRSLPGTYAIAEGSHYVCDGIPCPLEGTLTIQPDQKVRVAMMDRNAPAGSNVRGASGVMTEDLERQVRNLIFNVSVPGKTLLNLLYQLSAPITGEDASGEYTGHWLPTEKGLLSPVNGPVDLPSGEQMHYVGRPKLVPREKDMRHQEATIILRREG